MAFGNVPDATEIEKMIKDHLELNPDLKYFVSDDIKVILQPLIEAISYAVHQSIRETERKYERDLRNSISRF